MLSLSPRRKRELDSKTRPPRLISQHGGRRAKIVLVCKPRMQERCGSRYSRFHAAYNLRTYVSVAASYSGEAAASSHRLPRAYHSLTGVWQTRVGAAQSI